MLCGLNPQSVLPDYLSLNMASKYHNDWQSSKKSVLERNRYMFDNELMSDIAFTCWDSSRVFHAHKYVLATSSAVFYAMFYGDLAQRESTINLPDVDEKGFQEFLRFLYTDECKITAENGVQILYLAKKYLVSSLAEKCCDVLKASVKPENVFVVLEQAIQFDEEVLEAKCWHIISENTLESMSTEGFMRNVKSATLNALLKRRVLTTTEVELFQGVLKWVDKECARQGINIEDDNTARRRVLGDSVYEIRFLEMSEQDFAKYVTPSGILTPEEIVAIFQKFNGVEVSGFKWKSKGGRRRQIVSFRRFDISQLSGTSWGYTDGFTDGLTLSVNEAVRFCGARLFGDSKGSQYQITFKIKDESVTGTYTSEQDGDGVWGYDVMLPKPVSLLPGQNGTIFATIKGPQSYFGNNGKSSVQVDDIVVTFDDATFKCSNSTNRSRGQFYKVFLSRQ